MPPRRVQQSAYSRVYTIEDQAGPSHSPVYQSYARALGVTWAKGDVTPVRIPDPNTYGRFITIDEVKGQDGLPTLSIENILTRDLSSFLSLARKDCPFDVQLHVGVCENPMDFNLGWEKIHVLEKARITQYGTGDLGAMDANTNVPVLETLPLTADDYYEVVRVNGTEIAATEVVSEIVDVVICDSRACSECGLPSNGCEKIFALTKRNGGSPGLPAWVVYSPDAGVTVGTSVITSLAVNNDPSAFTCVGERLVVVSSQDVSLHYVTIADLLNGVGVWAEATTGFVALKGPNAIFSLGRTQTWIAADGGYIYFSDDVTGGVETQTGGALTVQDLLAIHGVDENNLVAVGASNSCLVTNDGGKTWVTITGPVVGQDLNTVWMKSDLEWFVGAANGRLYYTLNGGTTWTEKAIPSGGSGSIADISFSTPTVGYLSQNLGTPRGRVLRTIDGGNSWYVLPEQSGYSLPLSDKINAVFACAEDPNFCLAGGLGDNASDGIWLKIA